MEVCRGGDGAGVGCVEVGAVGCEGEDGEGWEDYCYGADWAARGGRCTAAAGSGGFGAG